LGRPLCYLYSGSYQGEIDIATYQIEYTLPGEYGKVQKKTFKSAPERDAGIKKLKEKGAKIKSTVWVN